MRDKLIELLDKIQLHGFDPPADAERYDPIYPTNEEIADHLLANGVTIRERGEWIRQTRELNAIKSEAICSNCGRDVVYQIIDDKWTWENFCPHCGADMRGEKNEDQSS